MNPITVFLVIVCVAAGVVVGNWVHLYLAFVFFAAAILIGLSLKMANVWQKFVILRMGKLQGVRGAGFFAIVPLLDRVIAVIDEHIHTTAFNAEQALTKDTVPVKGKFVEAAATYAGHPVALQLRAMNIIYETAKGRGATILMPSSMVDSLNPSAATLALALASKDGIQPDLVRRPLAAA